MNLSLSLLRETVPVGNEPAVNYCLLEVTPPPRNQGRRGGMDLVLVIDKSGSMQAESKLRNVQKAAEKIVELLEPEDRLSLVVFACQASEVFALANVTNKSFFIDKIRNLDSVGVGNSTVMSSGMRIAYNTLKQSHSSLRRIILLTDGEVTENDSAPREVGAMCSTAGIQVRCVGVGSDWNMKLLNDLDWRHEAEYIERGQYHSIPERFAGEFSAMANTSAADVKLQFKLVNGVEVQKCSRFHPQISVVDSEAGTNNYSIGTLSAGTKEYFLFQMLLPPRGAEGNYMLGQFTISYKDMASGERRETPPGSIRAAYSADGILASMVNPQVQNYVKQLTAHTMVERATGLIGSGDVAMGTTILGKAARLTGELGNKQLQNMLTGVLETVRKTGALSPEDQKNIFYGTRKTSILNE